MRVKFFLKSVGKVSVALAVVGALIMVTNSFAGDTAGLTLSGIGGNITKSVSSVAKILSNVALISGIGFILAAFFKFHQHKQQPTQVPLSQGITLLLIGSGLTLFPIMIPTARNSIAGSSASISTLSGSGIGKIIGGT